MGSLIIVPLLGLGMPTMAIQKKRWLMPNDCQPLANRVKLGKGGRNRVEQGEKWEKRGEAV